MPVHVVQFCVPVAERVSAEFVEQVCVNEVPEQRVEGAGPQVPVQVEHDRVPATVLVRV